MNKHNEEFTMHGPSYHWLKDTLEPAPKPKSKKRYENDELPEEATALLQLLEEELEKALNKGDEVEFTPDLSMALDRLNELEKVFANDPRTHYLACLLRAKIDEITATYNHKAVDANKEDAELEEESGLSLIAPIPTPLSMIPEPKSSSEREKVEEKDNSVDELDKKLNSQDPKDNELEQDKGYVPPFSRF